MMRMFRRKWIGVVTLTTLGWQGARADELPTDTAVDSAVDEATIKESPEEPVIFEANIVTGFVFIETEYLPAPYLIQATVDSVTVNGRTWPMEDRQATRFDGDGDGDGRWSRWRGESDRTPGGGFGGFHPSRGAARRLVDYLESESLVIGLAGRRPEVVNSTMDQHDVFASLLDPEKELDQEFLELRGSDEERQFWKTWTAGAVIDDEFRARAGVVVEELAAISGRNEAEIRATRRLHAFAYPLTVLGMVLGVLALGHLLKSFHNLESAPPEALRATAICIALMVLLSLFDLTWTILASQAGQMRELNPLGSRLIADPAMLIVFKFAATLVGCGVLFALRRHQRARQACWWLCLVCTVLTFRWVMFNSMFVA